MFPQSDDDLRELLRGSGPHHEVKDPPPQKEIDAHLLIAPAAAQFQIEATGVARVYAVTTNFSYYPIKVDLKFSVSGKAITLHGQTEDTIKVPPMRRDNQPGLKGRFCQITSTIKGNRCDIECNWLISGTGKPVSADLSISVETK